MESLDLNIDNYDYNDILNLFKINIHFGENDMKEAKKKVLLMHPDKSGLDKKYFLFFSSAYKILYSVYEFREKSKKNEKIKLSNEKIEYLLDEEEEKNKELINTLKDKNYFKEKDFNKWFNEMFDKVKLDSEYSNEGYGNWLHNHEENVDEAKNLNDMNLKINKKKQELRDRSIQKYNEIQEFNNASFCDLTNCKPDDYSSGIFSKFQFEDLKKAHEESVVPILDTDHVNRHRDVFELKTARNNDNITPLSEIEAKQALSELNKKDNVVNSNRAYKLYKQQEKIENANKEWWKNLRLLK